MIQTEKNMIILFWIDFILEYKLLYCKKIDIKYFKNILYYLQKNNNIKNDILY